MILEKGITEAVPASATRVAVLCLPGFQSFLAEIVTWLQQRFDTRTCYSENPQEIAATVAWADVVWLEWANALAVGLTKNAALLEGKRVICRLHSYEAFEDDIATINWSRIDELICVAPHILEIVKARVPDLADRCGRLSIIPNGIDVDALSYRKRQKGFNLAYLGYINYKKGPMLLLQVLKELVRIDPRYRLTIGGKVQDLRYKLYFDQMIPVMGLTPNVRFDGWIDDVNGWLADKDYILCTSLLESQGVGLMEAMGCGIKPVIHNFVGATAIYPQQNLWNTVQEAVNLVCDPEYDSSAYRRWIENRFGLAEQLSKIEQSITGQRVVGGTIINSIPPPKAKIPSKNVPNATGPALSQQFPALSPQIKKMLQTCVQPDMQALALGCGTGAVARFMGSLGARVIAVDDNPAALAAARRDHAHERVDYRLVTYEQMQLPAAFDLVTVINTLETVGESALVPFIKTIARHVSPKAVVYLNIKDGRYLEFLRDKRATTIEPQLVAHRPDALLASFASVGFQAYHINFYGDAVPLKYNEFLFTTQTAFRQTYGSVS